MEVSSVEAQDDDMRDEIADGRAGGEKGEQIEGQVITPTRLQRDIAAITEAGQARQAWRGNSSAQNSTTFAWTHGRHGRRVE